MRPPIRRILLVAALVACCGCGYRVVRLTLPEASGGCVRFGGVQGGGAWPRTALWTASALQREIAPDLCPSGEGDAVISGEVEAVEPMGSHLAVGATGPVRVGGRWMARGSIRIDSGGRTVWGPFGAEVERDFVSTGDPMLEQDAFDAHLELLCEDLARAMASILYDRPL